MTDTVRHGRNWRAWWRALQHDHNAATGEDLQRRIVAIHDCPTCWSRYLGRFDARYGDVPDRDCDTRSKYWRRRKRAERQARRRTERVNFAKGWDIHPNPGREWL